MLECKIFEIRDSGTFIPALATRLDYGFLNNQEAYLLRRCGYTQSPPYSIILTKLQSGESKNDIYDWNNRTMQVAHKHIEAKWHDLEAGQVIDIQFILGETLAPKLTERYTVEL